MVCWVKDETLKTVFVKQEVLKVEMACTSSYLVSNMFHHLAFFSCDLSVKAFSSVSIFVNLGVLDFDLSWSPVLQALFWTSPLVTTNHD